MAAVLAVGDGAVLSGLCAADLWELRRFPPERQVEILVPRRHRGLAGARVRHTRTLIGHEVTVRNGLPVTTVSRTLVDLAEILGPYQLANAMHEAAFRRRFDVVEIRRAMERNRNRNRNGHRTLSHALEMYLAGSVGTRSNLEDRFLTIMRGAGVGLPLVNVRVPVNRGALEVDFHWPRSRLCVEVDGSGHKRPRSRREDARRDRLLRTAGQHVLRVPGYMIELDPEAVAQRVIESLDVVDLLA